MHIHNDNLYVYLCIHDVICISANSWLFWAPAGNVRFILKRQNALRFGKKENIIINDMAAKKNKNNTQSKAPSAMKAFSNGDIKSFHANNHAIREDDFRGFFPFLSVPQ